MSDAPRSLTGRLDEAAEELLGLADDLKHRAADYTAKSMQSTLHSNFRKRTAPTTDEEDS
jgi:hypothetical protein